jgi:hypothetical protein
MFPRTRIDGRQFCREKLKSGEPGVRWFQTGGVEQRLCLLQTSLVWMSLWHLCERAIFRNSSFVVAPPLSLEFFLRNTPFQEIEHRILALVAAQVRKKKPHCRRD